MDRMGTRTWIINLIGNIGVFVPFGVFLPLMMRGRLIKALVAFVIGVLILESAQLLSKRGSFDIDDLILNSFGFIFGYGAYLVFKGLLDRRIVE